MTNMPAAPSASGIVVSCAPATAPTSWSSTANASTTSPPATIPPCTPGRRARPRQRRPRRRWRRAHGRAPRPSPAQTQRRSTSAPTCTPSRRTRCGTRCARPSSVGRRIGEDPSVNELQERMAALLGKEAALWVPTCGMANLVALLTIAPARQHRRPGILLDVLTSEELGIEEIAGLEPRRSGRRTGGSTRQRWRS